MTVTIQLFAFLREALGDTVVLDVEAPVTARRLMATVSRNG